jgi:hypothetical protein
MGGMGHHDEPWRQRQRQGMPVRKIGPGRRTCQDQESLLIALKLSKEKLPRLLYFAMPYKIIES